MSHENVEVVRRFLGALERGDYEEAVGCLDPDAEWHNTAAFPGPRSVVGPGAVIEFWQTLVDTFAPTEYGMQIERVAEVDDLLVIGVHSWGRGASSDIPIDVRWALQVSMRDGRIQRMDARGDYARAWKAAGLSG